MELLAVQVSTHRREIGWRAAAKAWLVWSDFHAFDRHEALGRGAFRAQSGEVGKFAVSEAAPDQRPARPNAFRRLGVLVRFEVGEFEAGPIVRPRPLRAPACREAAPRGGCEILRYFLEGARDGGRTAQEGTWCAPVTLST